MANYYLASVGNGELFAKDEENKLQHVASVRTLTESTLGFSSTMEDVRAGQGAKLYGRFNHDAGMTVTLTDAMFKLEYLQWQTGSEIIRGLDKDEKVSTMESEQITIATAGTATLSKPAVALGRGCGLDSIIVWYRKAGCGASEDMKSVTLDSSSATVTAEDLEMGETYCFYYFANNEQARSMLVSANFIPSELVLVLTANLFEGSAMGGRSTGKPAGQITIKIPRFQLDGTLDLSMAMSSAATMALNGTALATDDGSCDGAGIYAEIVEVITNSDPYATLYAITPEESEYSAATASGEVINVYGLFRDSSPALLDPATLTFTGNPAEMTVDSEGVIGGTVSEGTITVKVTALGEKSPVAEITVGA